jgi:hypothetical protein
MAKFDANYIKQNPKLFGALFVVFGLGVYLLLNRRAAGGGTVVNQVGVAQPTDAQVAAGAQVQLAQINAGASLQGAQLQLAAMTAQSQGDLAIATMQAELAHYQIGTDAALRSQETTTGLQAVQAQLDNALAVANSNNSFALDYARSAQDSAVSMTLINANLQRDLGAQSADLTAKLSRDQLTAYSVGAVAAQIPKLKSVDRDNIAALALGIGSGQGLNYHDNGSGSFVLGATKAGFNFNPALITTSPGFQGVATMAGAI